ncbi:hypothetical protein L7F22_028347 [Adiantum nelumboides]|nr:hypothetical protein [Adiantum nelumboides]
MQSEYNSILADETWELIDLPEGKTVLPCKWVYKKKYTAKNPELKYKARLVAKGFKQKKGVDFDEIFSPVVKMTTLHLVLGLVAIEDMELVQMDVKSAFLHGDLDKYVYMKQQEGFEVKLEKTTRAELMQGGKALSTPMDAYVKLSKNDCPKSDAKKEKMEKVPYSAAVGSLMYAVGVVSMYMTNPGKKHWEAVKHVLRYLKGSANKCLCFGNSDTSIVGYTGSDYAGFVDTRSSTSGNVFLFAGAAVSWRSCFQNL